MKIANYLIKDTLHQGKKFFVYRAKKPDSTGYYILKTLEKKAAHHFKIAQALKNEYSFLKQVDSQHVIKAADWIEDKDHAILVLEDIDGISLKDHLKKGPLPLNQFIEMALLITNGLAAVHQQDIIHQDINPTNIIWHPQTGKLQLIDFDIASKFDVKISYLGNPEKLHGTLPYISPEQSGRMNRRVDQRTDLYSLGVTFYEMSTGQLPFRHRRPMEIVYAHLARAPEPPHLVNEQVPGILSQILLKLLAKNPEERYQSVAGLKYDLEKAVKRNWSDFKLGERDFSGKLQIPEKLYGREQEIEQLLKAYREASHGAKEMILVAGFSGTGKTALVNEIPTPITKDRGYFISGKFDQLQRTIPYFAFTQAFDQLCQLLLTEKQEILDLWKDRILQAVGKLGKVLTDVIPQLETIIGKQPDIPELGGEEAQRRFNYAFQCFLHAVCTKEHPLVIFIDDLQWADLASLNLLQVLMEEKKINYLLFIGAYRDNEVSASHPLITTLEEIRKEVKDIGTIPVKNLSVENLQEWFKDTLKAASNRDVLNLARLVYQKTQGNAFFTIQFLENLYNEDLLRFDFKQSGWTYDIMEIQKQNITDNVVELMVRKIQTLPTGGQEALKLAACIGNAFDLDTLSVISQKDAAEQERNLEIALSQYLISPLEDERYKFVHDRIHQAAYSLISDEDKKPLHLKIGRLLLKNYETSPTSIGPQEVEKHLFDIVNHLNIGIDLIEPEKEKLELARLNMEAAQHARRSGAYKLGWNYVQKAVHLLPGDCWQRHYDLTLAVHDEAVQTSYLCGDFEELDKAVEAVLQFTPNILDKTTAYEHRMMGFIAKDQAHLAVETLLDSLNKVGIDIPDNPEAEQTMALLGSVQTMLKTKVNLTKLPLISDPKSRIVFRLFANGGATAMAHGGQFLFPFVVGKMVEITLEYGLAPELPFAFACYGIIRNLMGDPADAYQVGKTSLALLDKIPGTDIGKPKAMVASCLYLLSWKEHYKEVAKRLKKNYQDALNVGDVEFAIYSIEYSALYLSRTDTELAELEDILDTAQKTALQLKQPMLVDFVLANYHVAKDLSGQRLRPAFLDIDADSFIKNVQEGTRQFIGYDFYIRKTYLAYLFEDYSHILEDIQEAEKIWNTITLPIVFLKSDLHFYIPLVYLKLYTGTEEKEHKEAYLTKAKETIKILDQWAKLGPVNFLHKYYLAKAELHRVTGKFKRAAEYYEKAIEKAYENEYINEAAIANELAAKFYMQNNQHKVAAFFFVEAKNCYYKWGAKAKVKHLEEKYPKYLSIRIPVSTLTTGTISSYSTDTTGEFLDVNSILKATQTLSGEVQLKSLLEKMMQILIENAGAQKILLLENTGKDLLIQAEGSTDGVSGILQALPVEESGKVPLSVINYVAHSKQKLVFDNISKDTTYSTDHYIQKHQSKSAVCFPILSKGELAAIIYLENNLVEGAFTPARLEILNMLSAQIAISVENTRLYENLEEKVKQRTIALRQAHQQLEKNHQALEESHKKMNDSVNYASRIQNAVLPGQETLAKLLPQHFILYRPCAGVSGDFYWVRQIGQKIIAVAADCTGHGVPGALVSMLGTAFLNDIVPHLAAQSQLTAGKILDELRTKVKIALKQIGQISDQKEGMDIALCIIDLDKKQLQYAGAHHPLYLIRDNQLTEVKGDKMPIGIHRKEQPFTSHDILFQKGDMIYLFSDGYVDQFSEKKKEKFMRRNFKKLLIEINQEPLSRQKEILIKRFEEWKGDLPQVDDILIFGIRL